MAEESGGKFAYFLAGLGIGSLVGILFAPRSGEETRELLSNRVDDGRTYVEKRGREIREQAEEYVERGKKVANKTKESVTAGVEAGKQAYREAASREAS